MSIKQVILFGGTGGIGSNLLPLLLHNGYFVTLAVRDTSNVKSLIADYSMKQQSLLEFVRVDLAVEQSIRAFLLNYTSEDLEMIIFCSGVRGPSSSSYLNSDFEVNYIAPLSIAINLLNRFPKLRVINVTSSAAFRFRHQSPKSLFVKSSSSFGGNYSRSKLALVLASYCLAELYPHSQILSIDPGSNRTKMTLGKDAPLMLKIAARFLFTNPNVGAKRIMRAILNENIPSGTHINGDGTLRDLSPYSDFIRYLQIQIFKGYPYMPS